MGTISVETDLCITMSAEHGHDRVIETLIVTTLLRGNTAQDAPRPLSMYEPEAYGTATSITPSAATLTWLVPASTSGVGAASSREDFIIMATGARRYGCG